MGLPHFAAGCVYILLMPGLRVAYLHQSHVGKFGHSAIEDLYGHHVVFAVSHGQCREILLPVDKIAQQKSGATAFYNLCEIFHSLPDVCGLALRREIQKFTNDTEDVLAPLLRRNKLLYPVGEENDTDFIIVLDGRESQ